MRELLRDVQTRRFLAGTTISMIGDNALWLTLSIWVKVLTGSTSAAGLSIFMLTLGSMTGPLTGIVVDRVRRRPLLMGVDAATGLLVATLLFVRSDAQLWLIFLVMFGYGVAGAVTGAAQSALVQNLVPDALLGQANSVTQTISQGSRLIVPLICAGAFAAFGAKPIILADCITFVIAIAFLARVRVAEPAPEPSDEHWLRELSAGARHLWTERVLRSSSAAAVLVIITFGLSETIIYAVVDQGLHRSPPFLGVLTSAQGAGAILGGVTAATLIRRLGERRVVAIGSALAGLSFVLLALPNLVGVMIGMAVFGTCLSLIVVGLITMLQRRTPPGLMGRAGAAFNFVLTVPQTLAIAVGAAVVAVVDYRFMLAAMALADLVAAGYLITRRQPEAVPAEALAGLSSSEPT